MGHECASVAVVAQIDRTSQGQTPVSEKVHRDSNSARREHSVRPYDLWSWACIAIPSSLLRWVPFIDKSQTSEARRAWHRKNDLAGHPRGFVTYNSYAKANVHVRDDEAP